MNIAVAQSGGPTCVINASLAGIFLCASRSREVGTIFGSLNGIEGILKDRLVELNPLLSSPEQLELLLQTPSTVLGSCRRRLPDPDSEDALYQTIRATLEKHEIGAFFYIGGNDSMDTVDKLSRWLRQHGSPIRVIGVPKTIDNDLMYTDHTPGFGSAAKYLATTLLEIVRDSSVYNLQSVTIVEIMGRNAGWLTASSCLLRANGETAPHLIYLPEAPFSAEKFLRDVREQQRRHKAVVVAVSEGVSLGTDDSFRSGATDAFGHKYLSGIGKLLEHLVQRELGCKVRSVELNVMQRCSSHLVSVTDLSEAQMAGEAAVQAALRGENGKMITLVREGNVPYRSSCGTVDASAVANREKRFPAKWIAPEQNDVLPEAMDYFLPLIQGELPLRMNNGIPMHFVLDP